MSSRSHSRGSEGDWTCPDPDCGNVNFARRSSCNRCGTDKSDSKNKKTIGVEIGKAAAEKSRGLFSADDWHCTKCGNVNWARRSSCNMCNAPKVGDVEERTGYGGGYNDRGVVEYKEREESDDEYDEFGRRKKKFRKADGDQGEPTAKRERRNDSDSEKDKDTQTQSRPAEKPKVVHDEDEEEEDDEDDEEGDLSKYDLSGWGDEEDDSDSKAEKDSKT